MERKETLRCSVCGDFRDVLKHYGVHCCYGCKAFFRRSINEKKKYHCASSGRCTIERANRNRCRHCRFKKCLHVGMSESNIRDNRSNKPSSEEESPSSMRVVSPPSVPSYHLDAARPTTSGCSMSSDSDTLISFLASMTRTCIDNYDPQFEKLTQEQWKELEKSYGRTVSLEEGLRDPSKVAPRTKLNFDCERPAKNHDIAFCWYRGFVLVADWANSMPQFRLLTPEDQRELFRLNFVNVSIIIYLFHAIAHNLNSLEKIPVGNGSYISPSEMENDILTRMTARTADAYEKHLFGPLVALKMDFNELTLVNALLLFQCYESLSSPGKAVAEQFINKLLDAFFEYQIQRFPEKTPAERGRRQSKLLMVIARISQIWTVESEIHLMLSTFNQINIDGIPRELLFQQFEEREERCTESRAAPATKHISGL